MAKSVMLTSEAANLMISIATAVRDLPSGVPCKTCDDAAAAAKELERAGMIERVHVGNSAGAIPTKLGLRFVKDAIRHFGN